MKSNVKSMSRSMKCYLSVVMMLLVIFLFTGCVQDREEISEISIEQPSLTEQTNLIEEEMKEVENIDEEIITSEEVKSNEAIKSNEDPIDINEMAQRALLQLGNTQRIQNAIKKARDGESVTIAYLGGSITQGGNASPGETNCYANLSYMKFKGMFGQENVHYVNAGVAGTPSTFGLLRVEKDVLSYKPDVVVVEFAVNDEGKPFNQYIYESLVRRILKSETEPAVILMFTVFEKGYNAQEHMMKVGEYYDLPMISVKDAIFPEIEAGRMNFKEDYGKDGLHPDNAGHAMIADFFAYYFEQADAALDTTEFVVRDNSIFDKSYEKLENIDFESANIQSFGGFSKETIQCFTYHEGYVKDKQLEGGIEMVMAFDEMIVAHQQFANVSYGTLDIYVDDVLAGKLDGYKEGAWNNVIVTPIENPFDDSTEHKVRFEMEEASQDKGFVLLDIGTITRD